MEYKECESCPGYCCITNSELYTPLTNEDIIRIAKHLKIPLDRFMREFVVDTRGRVVYDKAPNAIAHFKTLGPCPFLRQGLCGINDVKPKTCREIKPLQLAGVSCAEWYKVRLGFKTTEEKEEITIHPTTAEASY